MANTYEAIATVTVGSGGAASIEFTSIPGTYTDLYLVVSARTNRVEIEDTIRMQVGNGTVNTGNNYTTRNLYAIAGSNVYSDTHTSIAYFVIQSAAAAANATANTFGNGGIYLPNYAGSSNKSASSDATAENNGTSVLGFGAHLWAQTSVIDIIKLVPNLGTTFNQYSTATLYGIKNS